MTQSLGLILAHCSLLREVLLLPPILYEEQLQLHISMAQSGLLLPLTSVIVEGPQRRRLSHEVSSFSLSMSPCHLDHPLQRGVHHQDWSEDDTTPS